MKTPDNLKLKIYPEMTMFRKKTGHYIAMLGDLSARGKTKEEAAELLGQKINKLNKNLGVRRILVTSKGTVFVLYFCVENWAYDIIHTDKSGQQSPGSCILSGDFEDSFNSMKKHWQDLENQGL